MALRFTKMHGAGNDFVVLDRRGDSAPLDAALVARLADRHRGVGFDQLLTIEPPRSLHAIASYRIWNTDGSMAQQCGNGARCLVAWLVQRDAIAHGDGPLTLDGPAGPIHATVDGDRVRVEMGVPRFAPEDVPFRLPDDAASGADGFSVQAGSALRHGSRDVADDALEHVIEVAGVPVTIGIASMGNPHALVVVDEVARAPVATLGPAIERHAAFPDRVNVGFAQVRDRTHVDLRVHERGVGETLACGSGACAAAAILRRRGVVDPRVEVTLPGGTLTIEWDGEGAPLWMSGPAAFVFEGEWTE